MYSISIDHICGYCEKEFVAFYPTKHGEIEFCNEDCKRSYLEKNGIALPEYMFAIDKMRAKINNLSNKDLLEMMRNTTLEEYGVEAYNEMSNEAQRRGIHPRDYIAIPPKVSEEAQKETRKEAKIGGTIGGMSIDTETRQWIHLRSLEWSGWTTFISPLVVPVLLIFLPWHIVLISFICFDMLWQAIEHTFISILLLKISYIAIQWFKWPMAIFCSIGLFMNGRYGVGILALLWPLVCSFISAPFEILLGWLGLRRSLGSISYAIAQKLGLIDATNNTL